MTRYPDTHWRDVAAAYQAGMPRGGVAVAKQWGVAVRTAHRWVAECRKRGLLPPTVPGSGQQRCAECGAPKSMWSETRRAKRVRA